MEMAGRLPALLAAALLRSVGSAAGTASGPSAHIEAALEWEARFGPHFDWARFGPRGAAASWKDELGSSSTAERRQLQSECLPGGKRGAPAAPRLCGQLALV